MRYRGGMNETIRPLSGAETAAAKQLLRSAPFAHLAMVEPGGPYVVPLNFAYTEDAGDPAAEFRGRVYFHTGEGRKTQALADRSARSAWRSPTASLSTKATALARTASRFGPCSSGAMPISSRTRGPREAALRVIVAKYDPGAIGAPFDEAVLARTLIYEVAIKEAGFRERPRPR